MGFIKTTSIRAGEFVITTYGEYSQYGIGRLLRCVRDCVLTKGEAPEDSDAFEVVSYWEVHEDENEGSRYTEEGSPQSHPDSNG